jgi:hypothetical protein
MSWQTGEGGGSRARTRDELAHQAPAKQRRYTFGTHAQTCHVWAQQNAATHTGQSSDGRIRFEGETIYSYGSHFPMARFVGSFEGRRVVLVNNSHYSVSTSKHMWDMRGSLLSSDIRVAVSTDFLKGVRHSANELTSTQDDLLENIAEQDAVSNRCALEAFRALFKVRAHVPTDIPAWYAERKRVAAAKAFKRKLDEARGVAKKLFSPWSIPENWKAPSADANAYYIQERIDRFARETACILSARLTLSRAKAPRKYIVACSKASTALREARATWEAALPIAQRSEARNARLEVLKTWPESYLYQSDYELGELWALAIAEGMTDTAALIGRKLQIDYWQAEVPETFKRYTYERVFVSPEQWEAGKGDANRYQPGDNGTLVRRKGDVLQTSRGAECPFSHAVKAFRIAQQCRATGTPWVTNGHKIPVGHFTVDRIDEAGTLQAGCHTIGFDAMLRLAVREVPEVVKACYPVPACI